MSAPFNLRKLPILDILLLVKIFDSVPQTNRLGEYLLDLAKLEEVGKNELNVSKIKLQILVVHQGNLTPPLSAEQLTDLKAKHNVTVVFKNIGVHDTERTRQINAYQASFQCPFSILVELPCLNLQSSASALEMLKPIVDGADFAVGERHLDLSPVNKIKLRLLHSYFWLRFGYPVRDWTSGYMAWRHWAISNVDYANFSSDGAGYLADLKNMSLYKGFRAQSVRIKGLPEPSELHFLKGLQFIHSMKSLRSTL